MSELEKPFVVGFDGLHRVGKGTQAALLTEHLARQGATSIIVRGDGTREGHGMTIGDPVSPEWQERSQRLKTYDRTISSWNLASYILLKELHETINNPSAPDVIIVDRTVISRASFLLHRGALAIDRRATLQELYPDATDEFDIMATLPQKVFDMQATSPAVLLDRLDPADAKYEFRAENIRGGFMPAAEAARYLPEELEARVEKIDASSDPQATHEHVVEALSSHI